MNLIFRSAPSLIRSEGRQFVSVSGLRHAHALCFTGR
jgi:hypothetical protein